MSTRHRSRPRTNTYTARLQQRSGKKARARRPKAARVNLSAGRQWAALLAVVAEAGHLAAAVAEWPAATPRGLFHVVAAGLIGLLAAYVYFGRTRLELAAGAALAVALVPAAWLLGAYQEFPVAAAIALSTVEPALAGHLATRWYTTRP